MIGEPERRTLTDVRGTKVRRFLARADMVDLEDEFWSLIYDGIASVPLKTARAVAVELEQSPRTVGDVLDGWRPKALH